MWQLGVFKLPGPVVAKFRNTPRGHPCTLRTAWDRSERGALASATAFNVALNSVLRSQHRYAVYLAVPSCHHCTMCCKLWLTDVSDLLQM